MSFVNNHGSEISEAELNEWAKEAEAGNFDNWQAVGEPTFDKYLDFDQNEAATLTFVCSPTLKIKVGDEAKRLQCTNSDLLRMLVTEGLNSLALNK